LRKDGAGLRSDGALAPLLRPCWRGCAQLAGRALWGWSRPFAGLSSLSSFCHRLRAVDGGWWMIAAILRQIAAARPPDGWPYAPWWRRRGGAAVALGRLLLPSPCWPMPPLWAWFFHFLRLYTHVRCWAVSESPRIAMRRRPRFHGRRSQLGGAGQHWRRGRPRSQSGWQHVSLSPACDDGAPGSLARARGPVDDYNHSRPGKRRSQVRSAQWALVGDARSGTRSLARACS
jgi:hypothetical protein